MTVAYRLKRGLFSFVLASGIYQLVVAASVKLFRIVAYTGHGSNICLKEGFLPVPVHFYSPIPDIQDLEKRKAWDRRSELRGINFRDDDQKQLLKVLGAHFSDECSWPLHATSNPADYFTQNPSFSFGCAASTHSMIRHFKPNAVIEIGSGMSSRIISKALQLNQNSAVYTIVDPFPSSAIREKKIGFTDLIAERVELLPPAFFDSLKENDILFIDSSHSVKIGSDVNYLFLEILPRLAPGVIVHIHDINLPYEYPKAYTVNESFRQFWTEQYLLQSFLCFNRGYDILLAMGYLMKDHKELFRAAFPSYDPTVHTFISGSFWIRRNT